MNNLEYLFTMPESLAQCVVTKMAHHFIEDKKNDTDYIKLDAIIWLKREANENEFVKIIREVAKDLEKFEEGKHV